MNFLTWDSGNILKTFFDCRNDLDLADIYWSLECRWKQKLCLETH